MDIGPANDGSKCDVLCIKCQAMFGYAFVNFVDEPQAQRARQVFEGWHVLLWCFNVLKW